MRGTDNRENILFQTDYGIRRCDVLENLGKWIDFANENYIGHQVVMWKIRLHRNYADAWTFLHVLNNKEAIF